MESKDLNCLMLSVSCLCSTFIQVVFVVNIGTPLVKANDALLSFSLLLGLVVTFLCSIVFLGEPQNWSCMTSQVALALGFALCLSSIMGGYNKCIPHSTSVYHMHQMIYPQQHHSHNILFSSPQTLHCSTLMCFLLQVNQ